MTAEDMIADLRAQVAKLASQLDAARFELRARGCGDPDALLHALAHRRARAA